MFGQVDCSISVMRYKLRDAARLIEFIISPKVVIIVAS